MIWLGVTALVLQAGEVAPVEASAAVGIPVKLMVMTEVSTARARAGDVVKLRVHRPVERDGAVVVPLGTPAFGEVVDVRPGGAGMRRGALGIRLTRLVIDGRPVPLGGAFDVRGRGGKGDDTARILLAPFYAPFASGNAARFKAGDILTGRLLAEDLGR